MEKTRMGHERKLSPSERSVVETRENWLIDAQFRIQELCTKQNIGKAQLASKVGISAKALSKLLAAEGNPTWKQTAAIYRALGEPIDAQCDRVRQLIRKRRIGRDTLCAEAGISPKLLSKTFQPKGNATLKQVAAVFHVLGNPDSFFALGT
jgi:DNA-binding phage protein